MLKLNQPKLTKTMNLSYIRSNIKRLRRIKGTTQREMALRLYMDERTYAKIERGVNKSMDIRLLSAIADILETDVSTLLENPANAADKATSEDKQETVAPEQKPALNSGASSNENVNLLQEILSLKEEIRALMEFQKKAVRLLSHK